MHSTWLSVINNRRTDGQAARAAGDSQEVEAGEVDESVQSNATDAISVQQPTASTSAARKSADEPGKSNYITT